MPHKYHNLQNLQLEDIPTYFLNTGKQVSLSTNHYLELVYFHFRLLYIGYVVPSFGSDHLNVHQFYIYIMEYKRHNYLFLPVLAIANKGLLLTRRIIELDTAIFSLLSNFNCYKVM